LKPTLVTDAIHGKPFAGDCWFARNSGSALAARVLIH